MHLSSIKAVLETPSAGRQKPQQEPETRLVAQLLDASTRNLAFHEVIKTYERKIYWHVRKLVIDHDDTNDVVQETFVKAWQHLDNFRADSRIYTWLYRIATNESLMFLRKKSKRFFLPLHDITSELESKLQSPQHFNGTRTERLLHQAILRLPEKQRVVFNLKYFEEMSYEEMAEVTETSVGALKASYHHAVKKVEDYLKKNLNP